MATITSVGTGAWGTAGTWDAGVPADGDDVIIANTHTVTFNVDQTAFVTGVKVTVNAGGVLDFTTSAGNYVLRLKSATGALVVNGTVNIGTIGSPILSTTTHTINSVGTYTITGTGLLTATGTEPTYKIIKLSGSEAIGQTRLEVDTNVTGDIWTVGKTIGIQNEERVIADVQSTYIDISAGLTAAKSANCPVYLISRNVTITNLTTADRGIKCPTVLNSCNIVATYLTEKNITITGGTYKFTGYFTNISETNKYITGGLFYNSVYSNAYYISGTALISCTATAVTFENCYLYACTLYYATVNNSTVINATINAINNSVFTNCDLTNNSINIPTITTYNCKFMGTVINTSLIPDVLIGAQFDAEQVAGAFKAYTKGGIVISQTTTKPDGYDMAYKHTSERVGHYWHWQQFSVLAGQSVTVEAQLRKDKSAAYLPRVYLTDVNTNPILNATSVIDSFTMTDSTDTWESDTFTIDNSTNTAGKVYRLYFIAYEYSSGTNVYSAYKVTPVGGGGGLLTHPSMSGGIHG